jgi:hypothetical protein
MTPAIAAPRTIDPTRRDELN